MTILARHLWWRILLPLAQSLRIAARPRRAGRGGWIGRLIEDLEDRIFAADDARARARGWQVIRPPSGFGRWYRDPRWDLVSACSDCAGRGQTPAGGCATCGGRGTVRLDQRYSPRGGAT